MALQDQVVPISFGKGLDTKTDPKAVIAGKLLRLENATFTSAERVGKRNGYDTLGVTSAPQMNHAYNNELIVADLGRMLSYSGADLNYVDRGPYISTELTRTSVDQIHQNSGQADCAVMGNYSLNAWSTAQNSDLSIVTRLFVSLTDLTTGATLLGPIEVTPNPTFGTLPNIRAVNMGGTTLAVFYCAGSGAAVVYRTVVFTAGVPSLSAETALVTFSLNGAPNTIFDIKGTSTGAVIASPIAAGSFVQIANLNTSVVCTAHIDVAARWSNTNNFAMSIDATNGNVWVYYDYFTFPASVATTNIDGIIVNQALSGVVLAKTLLYTTTAAPVVISQIVPASIGALQQSLYFGLYASTGAFSTCVDTTWQLTLTTAGVVGTPSVYAPGVIPFSKPIVINGTTYMVFVYRGAKLSVRTVTITPALQFLTAQDEPTYFLAQLSSTPYVVARFGAGSANTQVLLQNYVNFSMTPAKISATKYLFACGIGVQSFTSDAFVANPQIAATPALVGIFNYQFDFNSPNAYRAIDSSQVVLLNGGVLQIYDGASVTELGFHVPPEITNAGVSLVAGASMPNGTYQYYGIYQWTDNQGNLHQSTPSLAFAIDLVGPFNTISLTITPPFLTQKTGVVLAVFRASSSATGLAIPLLVTDPVFSIAIPPGATSIVFTDTMSNGTANIVTQNLSLTAVQTGPNGDLISIVFTGGATAGSEVVSVTGNAIDVQIQSGVSTTAQVKTALNASAAASALVTTASLTSTPTAVVTATSLLLSGGYGIVGNPPAYAYDNSLQVENDAPPPAMITLAHNNRTFFVSSEDEQIWYTKSFAAGTGMSPSAFLIEQIDPKFGHIVALEEMDDKLAIFKQTGLFIQSGDGADDNGNNSTLSFPQFIPSGVGCISMKSVVGTPKGIMFQSLSGIYVLDRGLNISYIGAEVEEYNGQTITSADMIPGTSQIRFLCSGGLTLVFDYIFNQWSTFTNHTGLSATIFQGLYTYATINGQIFQQTTDTYLDSATPFAVLAQTSWLTFANIQGAERVRWLAMLGDFVNGNSASHGIQVSTAYDFVDTFGTPVPFLPGAANASGVLNFRERLQQQKCQAVSFLIQEIVTGDMAESIDLTNMGFVVAVKKGLGKKSANTTSA